MIIEVLDQKYRCGCNRGVSKIEKPGILGKLNAIIEWDFCKFPRINKEDSELTADEKELKDKINGLGGTSDTIKELSGAIKELLDQSGITDLSVLDDKFTKENRTVLGEEPELKPGDCFLFKGQVIAVNDNDSLVLIVSETGALALERVWEEHIEPELKLMFNTYETGEVTHEVSSIDSIPENFEGNYSVPYYLYKIWKDRFVKGRGYLEKNLCIKTTIESEITFLPVTIYLLDWSVRYNLEEIEEDQIELVTHELLSWFYEKYSRLK